MNFIFLDFGASLDPLTPWSSTQTSHPNSLKCDTSGFFPVHPSNGVIPFRAFVGDLLRIYAACATASGQRKAGSPFAISIALPISNRVRLNLSRSEERRVGKECRS